MRSRQLLLQGTNFVNFVGMHSWVGLQGGFEAVRVTEWDEPQAVIGSYLHRYAYPDFFELHVTRNDRELVNWTRGRTFDRGLSGETRALEEFRNIVQGTGGRVGCLRIAAKFSSTRGAGFRVTISPRSPNKGCSSGSDRAVRRTEGHARALAQRPCMASPPTAEHPGCNRGWPPLRPGTNARRSACRGESGKGFHHDSIMRGTVRGGPYLVESTRWDGERAKNRLRRAVTEPDNIRRRPPNHAAALWLHHRRRGDVAISTTRSARDPRHDPVTDALRLGASMQRLWVATTRG